MIHDRTPWRGWPWLWTFVGCSLLFIGLVGCVDYSWVPPMRATYEAVAPEYAAWVGSDQYLLPAEKQRRLQTLSDWDAFLQRAEYEAGEELGK